jgi:hypothetical protein
VLSALLMRSDYPRINKTNTERIHMKNKSDNNTWAVITRKSIFVDAPSETYYFKKLDEAKQFMDRILRLPLDNEQAQLVKVMEWHEQEENCTDYHTAIGHTYEG